MIRSFRSELIRFRRTAVVGAGVMTAVAVAVTSFLFLGSGPGDGDGRGFGPGGGEASTDLAAVDGSVAGLVSVATMLGIIGLSMFAVSIARDYEYGTVRTMLVAEPHRRRLLAGKLMALTAMTATAVVLATVATIATSFVLSGSADVSTAAWTSSDGLTAALADVGNVGLAVIAWGLLGACVALATRSAATAISAGIGYLLVGENLLSLVWDGATDWLPGGVLSAFTGGGTATVAYTTAAALLAGYVLVAVSSSLVMFDRRDVTE